MTFTFAADDPLETTAESEPINPARRLFIDQGGGPKLQTPNPTPVFTTYPLFKVGIIQLGLLSGPPDLFTTYEVRVRMIPLADSTHTHRWGYARVYTTN